MQRKIKKPILILTIILSIILTSCDCYQNVTGTIVDAETNQPIEGAYVQKEHKDYDKDETDEKGNFKVESISGGFRCPPMTVIISKEGYETLTVKINNGGNEKIKLKRTTN